MNMISILHVHCTGYIYLFMYMINILHVQVTSTYT